MRKFANELLETALALGCEAAEICIDTGDSFYVKILDGELDAYEVSRTVALGLRVMVNGKMGYASAQSAEDGEFLVRRAIDNAKTVEVEDEQFFQTKHEYADVTPPHCPLCDLSEEEKIALAREMEKAAKAADPRVFQTPHCAVVTGHSARYMKNTRGMEAERASESGYIALEAAVRENDETHDGFAVRTGAHAMEWKECVEEAVEKAVSSFGAVSPAAEVCGVLLNNEAAADLLGAFSSTFCADRAQKGMSPFKDKVGEVIAAPCVTITDDPFYAEDPRAFDGEGTPCETTVVVESGVLKTLLHNLKTAKKAGVATTANASRPSAAATIGVGVSNFSILPGEKSADELRKELGNGFEITSVSGLHAGLNAVTGDFSLLASGFRITDGKRAGAVERMTAAGNFITLLKNIRALGSDLKFDPSGIGAPSVLLTELTLSGSGE